MNKWLSAKLIMPPAIAIVTALAIFGGYSNAQQSADAPQHQPKTNETADKHYRIKEYKFMYLGESDVMGAGEMASIFGGNSKGPYRDTIKISAKGIIQLSSHPSKVFGLPAIQMDISVNDKPIRTKDWNTLLPGANGTVSPDGSITFSSQELNEDEITKNLIGQIVEAIADAPAIESKPQSGKDRIGPYRASIVKELGDGKVIFTEKRRYQPLGQKYIRNLKPSKSTAARGTIVWKATYLKQGNQLHSVVRTDTMNHYIKKQLTGRENRKITLHHRALAGPSLARMNAKTVADPSSESKALKQRDATDIAVVESLQSLSATATKEEITGTYLALKKHLAQHEGTSNFLATFLANNDPKSLQFRIALLALSNVGSPVAQQVIAAAMIERVDEWSAFQQLSMSLAHVDAPEPASVRSIWQAHQVSGDKHSANHALYSYGTILRGLQEKDPKNPMLAEGYQNILGAMSQGEDLISGLIALGNYGYEAQEETLLLHLSSIDSRVRAEATSALRFVPTLSAELRIVDILLNDKTESVRLSAARALETRVLTHRSIDNLLDNMANETSLLVQKSMVKAIFQNTEDNQTMEERLLNQKNSQKVSIELKAYIANLVN